MLENLAISENCYTFIVLKYKELQTIIAMITEDKVTKLFCIADDFCKFFDAMMEKYTLKADKKRQYHRKSTMSKAEIMVIMILFHDSGYRCLKHFYIEKVCRHMRHLFPKVVSYNRFVELEKEVAIPLALFIKKVLLGKCTGISFVDSTPLNINVTYNRGEDLSQASYLPDEIKRRIFWRFTFYLLPLQRNNQYPTIMKLRLLSTLSLILCCVGSVLAYNLKYVRGLSNSSVLSIAQRPSGEMLFGTCDGLNSYDGNGMWLTAQNTGVILYGNLVEDVKTVGGSMWVLTNYGLNIMSPMGSKVDYYEQFKGLRKIRCNPSGDGFLLHDGHLWFLDKKGRFRWAASGRTRCATSACLMADCMYSCTTASCVMLSGRPTAGTT